MLTKGRLSRKKRIRSRLSGIAERPRLSIFRSNKYMYAQLIDDVKGVTLASVRDDSAIKVGEGIAKVAKDKKITKVVFDRSGYRYLGRVKALADAARAGGLEF